jgi:hypothetical protein
LNCPGDTGERRSVPIDRQAAAESCYPPFVALLPFQGIGTLSLPAQGKQRRLILFRQTSGYSAWQAYRRVHCPEEQAHA